MATITLKQLKKKGACIDQLVLFESTFGNSVAVTEKIARAYATEFDCLWAIENLLSEFGQHKHRTEFHLTSMKYTKARKDAYELYGCPSHEDEVNYALYEDECSRAWYPYIKEKFALFAKIYNDEQDNKLPWYKKIFTIFG